MNQYYSLNGFGTVRKWMYAAALDIDAEFAAEYDQSSERAYLRV